MLLLLSQFLLSLLLPLLVQGDGDVVVCGGFIKSSVKIPFSQVKVGVFSTDGILKESTECAPHNGYFLLPLYSKGQVSVKVLPPAGWSFEPSELALNIDGTTDKCSAGEDLNFVFKGFTVSGRILSKGLEVGPSGVTTMLIKSDGTQQHTTSVEGEFSIPHVLSGTYTVSFSHPDWKLEKPSAEITVEQDNFDIAEPFTVVSYNVRGLVQSSGQPIAGVEVYLSPLGGELSGPVDQCESVADSPLGICKVVSGTDGVFQFPALAPGKYQIVPHYQSEHSTFDVSPNQLVFTVLTDTVLLTDTFTVNGFAVLGKVLDSEGGKVLAGVAIYVNGDKVASTSAEGMFELSNVTSGEYAVEAKMKGYYFATQTLSISPTNPTLPDLFANAYQLCGKVSMHLPPKSALPLGQRKVGLQPAEEGTNVAMVTTLTDASGAFCFKVSPGKYSVQNLIGTTEHKDGLRLTPESVHVEVSNKPHHGTVFTQSLASVKGTVQCINTPCEEVPVLLTAPGGEETRVVVVEGEWEVKDILPGSYKVSVDYPRWCWSESDTTVDIDIDTNTQIPPFVQSGYIMKVQVSHAAQLNFSQAGDEGIGTFSLEPGTNRFCLKKWGVYELIPYTCHKFESEVYHYDTNSPEEIVLNAVQHLVSGEILSSDTQNPLQVALTNLDSHTKTVLDTQLVGDVDENGFSKLTYHMWSAPGQKYIVKPVSENLLFSPATQTIHVSDKECPTTVPVFHGHLGTFISGKITPPVRGVLVTLASPDNTELKLTQITDDKGEYSIGPLHNNIQYEVTAHKQDYDIHKSTGHDFTAVKLSKLTVNVQEGEGMLSGVLVSVSGTNGYRNNVVLDDKPLVLTGLVPGEYFIRPIMKEYMFTPSSKMMTVSEGLEVKLDLVAQRTAFSCYGVVTTLNGKPQANVVVEAVGAGECSLQEEGVTDVEGVYRIRGLPPNCPITMSVREDKSANIQRASPPSKLIKTEVADSKDVNFIVFYKPATLDITGYVDILEEYLSSTKVLLIEERGNGAGKFIHTSTLDTSRIFIFPDRALSSKYTLKLESSLSSSMYNYKIPEAKVPSEGPFQHIEVMFNPVRRGVHQEQVTRASFTALAIIVLSMVLAANHATLVPVFTQVFQSVMNRNNNDSPGGTGENNGMEYIDDIHRGIRRKAGKKR